MNYDEDITVPDDYFDSAPGAPIYGLTPDQSYYRYPPPPRNAIMTFSVVTEGVARLEAHDQPGRRVRGPAGPTDLAGVDGVDGPTRR